MKIKRKPNNKGEADLQRIQEMTVDTRNELDVISAKLDRILQKRNGGIKANPEPADKVTEE